MQSRTMVADRMPYRQALKAGACKTKLGGRAATHHVRLETRWLRASSPSTMLDASIKLTSRDKEYRLELGVRQRISRGRSRIETKKAHLETSAVGRYGRCRRSSARDASKRRRRLSAILMCCQYESAECQLASAHSLVKVVASTVMLSMLSSVR